MYGLMPFRDKSLPVRDFYNQLLSGMLEDDLLTTFGNPALTNAFRVDLRETENEYIVEADLPGVKKGDITLRYEGQYLTISAKRDEVNEIKDESYVRKERRCGQLQRSIYVNNIIEDRIEAKFNDGVLSVSLPKQDKAQKRRGNIQIN
ncbi:MAG: heat shock protein Hsp20 [Firmicutes bacterium]|nr:heat shock protein Hsp20 [Bacillota bacterium]